MSRRPRVNQMHDGIHGRGKKERTLLQKHRLNSRFSISGNSHRVEFRRYATSTARRPRTFPVSTSDNKEPVHVQSI